MIPHFEEKNLLQNLNKEALINCSRMATEIFI